MNPDIKDQNDENDDFKAIETLLKTYRSHNYIEKKKAIKSNAFQHPYNIKESLGDTLGDIVINLIPKEDLIQMKEIEKVPLHFEVTAKNVLSNNIKLTPAVTDDDTTELNFNTIMRVGDRLKRQAEIKLNDEHDKALQRQVERLIADKNKTLNEKIRPMERSIYEKNLTVIMEEFDNSKIAKAKQCIKMKIMNKICKKEIENNSNTIARSLKNILKMSAEKQEKEMRNEFYYQMQLARSELYEEFLDEKRECELYWEKELKTVKEKNDRALKHLKVSLEAEHIQNLTELEHWYEMQKQKKMLEQLNTNGTKKLKKKKYGNSPILIT